MAGENTTTAHLSDAMTTTEEMQITRGNSVTSSSIIDKFSFQIAVIVIGVVGTAGNTLIVYAMVASKQHKKHLLIFNQNALDLYTCVCLVMTYSVKLCNIPFTGARGYWLCMLFYSDTFIWIGTIGSVINVAGHLV